MMSSRSSLSSWRSSSGARSASFWPTGLLPAGLEQGLGRAVDQPDDAVVVDRDDAGGDARQHRLDEGAAAVELGVGGDQRAGLLLEPAGHPVEGVAERADLVVARRDAGTRAERSPAVTRRAASTSWPTGRTSRSASFSAIQIESADDQQRDQQQDGVEPELQRARARRASADSRWRRSAPRRSAASAVGFTARAP